MNVSFHLVTLDSSGRGKIEFQAKIFGRPNVESQLSNGRNDPIRTSNLELLEDTGNTSGEGDSTGFRLEFKPSETILSPLQKWERPFYRLRSRQTMLLLSVQLFILSRSNQWSIFTLDIIQWTVFTVDAVYPLIFSQCFTHLKAYSGSIIESAPDKRVGKRIESDESKYLPWWVTKFGVENFGSKKVNSATCQLQALRVWYP